MADSDCAPPGTDVRSEKSDDTDSKQSEIERHIQTLKVNLDDGSKANVFTRIGFNNHGSYLYNCNICKASNMTIGSIQTHLYGKKHQSKLLLPVLSAKLFYAQLKNPENKVLVPELCLAPGEPVPPGFEGEVKGVAEVQATIDETKSPLIGLEYLAELIRDQKEPQYVCTLCDKRGDPRTVMAHLTSYNHRLWYLEIHYPTLHKALYSWKNNKDYKKVVPMVVQNIVEAIETKFGRATPFIVDKDVFESNKGKYYEEARKDKHFSEKNGPNFMHLISKHIFDDLKSKQDEQIPSHEEAIESTAKRGTSCEKTSPEKKIKNDDIDDKKNYDDISSISSSSLSRSRSRSRSRGRQYDVRSRSRELNRRYSSHRRSRSRSCSPIRYRDRCYRRNTFRSKSRSRSRSSSRNMRSSQKPFGRDLYRKPRRLWETSMARGPYINYEKVEKRFVPPGRTPNESKRQIAPTPKELIQQASKLSTERYNLEKYRFAVEIMESEMEKVLAAHEKSPEKHPLYPEEWKKFWNRRYKELQAEKKDPAKHDFKSEWIKFWTERMKQLHKEEIENKRVKLREKYNIKENAEEENVLNLKQQYILKVKPPSIIDPNEIIILDDDRTSDRQSVGSPRSENKRSSRSLKSASPWDDDDDFEIKSRDSSSKRVHESGERNKTYDEWAKDYYGPNKSKTTFIRDLRSGSEISKEATYPALDPSECLNIVSVLRLLTALEDLLGSLGPKIINMLSTALAMEKAKANSAEDLLLNDANSVMFETVKEKLKGQLFAGILEQHKIQPVKTAIQKIAALLHQASEKQKVNEEEERKALAAKKFEPVTVLGVGSVDKSAIAKQIAAALVAQGKPNVTTDELEQLINAVVGMANASQGSDKPLTTAAYLARLQNTAKAECSSKNNEVQAEKKDPMDGLSDSDLKTLLQNFSNLSNDEQHGLIMYLKKLESREPERVENLRKFVNVEQFESITESRNDKSEMYHSSGRASPFSNREGGTNPSSDVTFSNTSRMSKSSDENSKFQEHVIESDDEDYSYEDVFKAASKNVKETQLQKDMKLIRETITRDRESGNSSSDKDMSLVDATSLIANLMNSLHNKTSERYSTSETTITKPHDNLEKSNSRVQPIILESSNSRIYPNTMESTNSRLHSNYLESTSTIISCKTPDPNNIRFQSSSSSDSSNMRTQSNSFDLNNSRLHSNFMESTRMNSNFSELNLHMRSNAEMSNTRSHSDKLQYNHMDAVYSNQNRNNSFANDRDFIQKTQDDFVITQGNFQNERLLTGKSFDQNKYRDNFRGQDRSFDINNFNIQGSMSYSNTDQSKFSSNMEQRFNQSRTLNIDPQRFSLNNQDYNNRPFQAQKFNQNNRFNSRGRYN